MSISVIKQTNKFSSELDLGVRTNQFIPDNKVPGA